MTEQLPLFGQPEGADPSAELERRFERLRRLAAALPPELRLGTSSWGFPGWAGLVYPRLVTAKALARDGLRDYVRHPLFRCVGIDRGYYAPIPESDLRRYSAQLPPGFLCCAKAPAVVTSPALPRASGPNPDFLSAELFRLEMLEPFDRLFRDHAGPFIIQLSAIPQTLGPAEFVERLDLFFEGLPRDFRYCVELRERRMLIPAYAQVLERYGAAHVYNYWTAMPRPGPQAAVLSPESFPFTVVRLMLRPGRSYAREREKFAPFDRLADPDPELREEVKQIVRRSAARRRDTFVLVNNKAEGSAPLTIEALAEALAGDSLRLRKAPGD